ncbi:YbfB/YjiJ family MFS transporter [Actinomadura montaniterrae]|uniref:YbfB/YjiJ family MFS transporter n=1 Tax=Actinomadura montaniterrae TaxID=1803903 RepID=A0A6L3VWA5_9ACTN|nr:YbfB/YjiJ family MFS transporter [Actinomadura montaniterrae]KAB2379249.1 YbfB/YjiJ family MFS transporter [Actinomadura montaniterrae]
MLVPAAANGLGRFAYGLLVPAMQNDLGWSSLTSGSLSAANSVGYLIGAIIADRALTVFGERNAVLGPLAVATLTVLACGATGDVIALAVLRLVAGAAGAVAFVAGAAVLTRLTAERETRALGLYFAGPGLGIAASALLVTPIAVAGHWRTGWLLDSVLCAACLALVAPVLARMPLAQPVLSGPRSWERRRVGALLASYGLFGAGYITYMTFSVAYLRANGRTPSQLEWFWFALGVAGIVIGLTLAAPLSRIRGGRGIAVTVATTALASGLPLLSSSSTAELASAALFGSFFSVSATVTAAARRSLPPTQWPPAIAGLTAAFGIGQCAGPVISGAVADGPHGLRAGLLTGTVLLAASGACALFHPSLSSLAAEPATETNPR